MENEIRFADTNLFLHYLTNDVPEQADAIEHLFRAAAEGGPTLVTNNLVIAEIIWVLESHYQLSRADIQNRVTAILNTPGLEVIDEDIILQSILWYGEKNVDFIDAYNAAWMID